MAKTILFMFPGACSRVAMAALEEIGVDYEDRVVNLRASAQRGAEYLVINPKGKVPTLSIDGKTLTENAAILAFLDRCYPKAALLPHCDGPIERMRCLSDLIWCSSTLHPVVRQIRAPHKLTEGDTAGVRADGLKKFAKECAYISDKVSGNEWWYGRRWSIVDVYTCWAYTTAAKDREFALHDYPHLLTHAERVRALPSFQLALARELRAMEREHLPIDPASL